jgi:hypothetical protein
MKRYTPRSPVLAILLFVVSLAFIACTRPPPRSQLDTADTVVSGAEILTKIACDDNGIFGRVHPLTLEAPEPTVEGVYQAVRSYVCADTFRGLLADARAILRRALDRVRASPSAENDAGPTAATDASTDDASSGAPGDTGPPPTAVTPTEDGGSR